MDFWDYLRPQNLGASQMGITKLLESCHNLSCHPEVTPSVNTSIKKKWGHVLNHRLNLKRNNGHPTSRQGPKFVSVKSRKEFLIVRRRFKKMGSMP